LSSSVFPLSLFNRFSFPVHFFSKLSGANQGHFSLFVWASIFMAYWSPLAQWLLVASAILSPIPDLENERVRLDPNFFSANPSFALHLPLKVWYLFGFINSLPCARTFASPS